MRGYYAFAWWRYDHAVHPMTPAVILETGFLTTAADRKIIVEQPELSAQGLANGIIIFLEGENLIIDE
jgi:N-acetylmuramoyl-L-alanine amidase